MAAGVNSGGPGRVGAGAAGRPLRPGPVGLVALAVALALAGVASAQPAGSSTGVVFTLQVSPQVGGQQDVYTATVRIEVPGVSGPTRYRPPPHRFLELVDSQVYQSTAMQFDAQRGQQLRTTETRRYILRPQRQGTFTVGPARMRWNGRDYETAAVAVFVGAAAAGAAARQLDPTAVGAVTVPGFAPPLRAAGDMFLHVVADRTSAHLGQQVVVSWLLYTRREVLRFEPRPPRMDGLWAETLFEPEARLSYREEVVDGTSYMAAVVAKRAVFPTQAGKVEVGPFQADVVTTGDLSGKSRRLASPPLVLQVQPLPAGAPPGFEPSYVGSFTVEAELDRSNIEAGESLTLTTVVRGEGAIRRTTPPQLAFPDFDLRRPADYEERVETAGDVVRGERVYRHWLTPRNGGPQIVPPVQIPYFNPQTGRYETARSRPIPIVVRGDPQALEGGSGRRADRSNVIARDIRLLREGRSVMPRTAHQLYRTYWFWSLALLPPLALLGFVAADRLRERLRRETPRARLRRARGRARRRLRVAEIHLRGNRPARFFGELARVLYEHLEERVGRPVQSMTRDELREFLTRQGFPTATIDAVVQELENCDFARFAPSAAGPGEMRAALRRTGELLRVIERVRPGDARDGGEVAA
jgi:hypothetical protein